MKMFQDADPIGSGGDPECKLQPPKGRETNQLVYLRIVLFNEVWKRNGAELFRDPVDPDKWKLPGYFDVIKQPMHLSLIREKLLQKKYLKAMECIQDFNLMFSNWYTYFKDTDERISVAESLEKYFWERLSHMPEKEEECDSTPKDIRKQKHASERTATVTIPNQETLIKDSKSVAENGNKSVSANKLRKGRATNQLDFLRNHVLNVMWKLHCAKPFREPVDPAKLNLPVDFDVVKHPIDLSSIKVKLDTNQYFSAKECLDDFTNMFSNCYKFYKSTGDEVIMAKILEKTYLTIIGNMPWPEVEIDLTPAHESEQTVVVESSEAAATSTRETQPQSSSSTTSNGEVVTKIEVTSSDEAKMEMEPSDKEISSEPQECSPDTPSRSSQAGAAVPVPVVSLPSSSDNSKAVPQFSSSATSNGEVVTVIEIISSDEGEMKMESSDKVLTSKPQEYNPNTPSRLSQAGAAVPVPVVYAPSFPRNSEATASSTLIRSTFDGKRKHSKRKHFRQKPSKRCNIKQLAYLREVVLNTLWNHPFAEPFRKATVVIELPEYFCDSFHERQVDFPLIKLKLESGAYNSFKRCKKDFDRMFSHICSYYKRNNQLLKKAELLKRIFDLQIRVMPPPEMARDVGDARCVDQSLSAGSNQENQQSDNCNLTNQLVYIRDVVLSKMWKHDCATPFREPVNPAKRNVPHYFDIIKHPMDLSLIKEKLETNQYFSASQCVEDFNLMFSNCYKYFKANSYEYQMAQKLEEIFLEMASNIPLQKQVKSTSEPENKRRRVSEGSELSANAEGRPVTESFVLATTSNQVQVISSESEKTGSLNEQEPCEGRETNQLVFLHKHVLDELWKLSSAELFKKPMDTNKWNLPDYFDVIEQPMDLSLIKKKLETNQYLNAVECLQDFNLVFSNCYKYFKPNDRIRKSAIELEEQFTKKVRHMPVVEKVFDRTWKPDAEEKPVTESLVLATTSNQDSRGGKVPSLASSCQRPCCYASQYQNPEIATSSGQMVSSTQQEYNPKTQVTLSQSTDIPVAMTPARSSSQAGGPVVQDVSDVSLADDERHPASKGQPRKRRVTNKLYFLEKIVMNYVWKHQHAWRFREPLDPAKSNLPDYFHVVKNPMDLNTIRKKLMAKEYYFAEECMTDFNLIFSNCYKYFKPADEAYKMAEVLEKFFMELIKGKPVFEKEIGPQEIDRINKKLKRLVAVPAFIEKALARQHLLSINAKVHDAASGSGSNSTDEQKPREGRLTNQLVYIHKLGLNSVWNHHSAKLFHKPINPVELKLPNYFDVVKQPMDMSLIKMKLETKKYYCASECLNDFRLMFSNCYNYFKPGDKMYLAAKSTEVNFQKRLTGMPWPEVEVDSFFRVSPHLAAFHKNSMKPKPKTGPVLSVKKWKREIQAIFDD